MKMIWSLLLKTNKSEGYNKHNFLTVFSISLFGNITIPCLLHFKINQLEFQMFAYYFKRKVNTSLIIVMSCFPFIYKIIYLSSEQFNNQYKILLNISNKAIVYWNLHVRFLCMIHYWKDTFEADIGIYYALCIK